MEITQFTYFQRIGLYDCKPVPVEITYGLERIAMYIQDIDNIFDLKWNDVVTYREIFHRGEYDNSKYSFEVADSDLLFAHFNDYEKEATRLIENELIMPAYDYVLQCSHTFNVLDARGAISVTERAAFIGRIRTLAHKVATLQLNVDNSINSNNQNKALLNEENNNQSVKEVK
jgi:glycyl-tRNA synthetase alpha chain